MSPQSISSLGLILDVIGAGFFIVDTNRLFLILSRIVKQIAEDNGKMDAHRFSQQEIQGLQSGINSSRRFTLLGSILLGTGFLLQLIGAYLQ